MKSSSNIIPETLQPLGNGAWHYNFNVRTVMKSTTEEMPESIEYEYESVKIWGTPTYDKCVKAVLRDKHNETQEFALINKYNAFALGISDNPTDKEEYEAYLKEVIEIKAMVKADLAKANIYSI